VIVSGRCEDYDATKQAHSGGKGGGGAHYRVLSSKQATLMPDYCWFIEGYKSHSWTWIKARVNRLNDRNRKSICNRFDAHCLK
jgi:hypothetical protein